MADNENRYKGRLFLIPTPLGDYAPGEVLPAGVLEHILSIDTYVVEELRTARRFLSAAGRKGHIDELTLVELNEHTRDEEVRGYLSFFEKGDVGLISEAGLPAVADPGSILVGLCHAHGIEVVPLVGPSSLMMSLMSSGLNGQRFAFNGYLPAKTEERRSALRSLEKRSSSLGESEIFIETPYRNDQMLRDILAVCHPGTSVCIAADITLPTQFIRTRRVEQWKKDIPTIGKRPCVFIILAR